MDSDMEDRSNIRVPLRVTIFIVNAVGCSLLSVLVISVSLSERLHRRDPVVNNFLYTWILLSALASFDELSVLANRNLGDTTTVRESVLQLITMVSTLNLSIHLWYIMRSPYHICSPKAKKLRTLGLVVTPYLFGLLPLSQLYSEAVGGSIFGLFALLTSILTPIADAILLFYYWRWYWVTRKVEAIGVMSLSFFIRLLAFSIYQLGYTILLILGATSGPLSIWSVAFKLLQNMFPLLAFCVVGLHKDILQLWFPCLWKRTTSTRSIQDDPINISSNKIAILPDDMNGDFRHLLEREIGDRGHEDGLDLTMTSP